MDAISYLRHEHSKFRRMLAAISKTSQEKSKKTKFKAFCRDLIKHETMEQKIWYPVLRQYPELRETIKHLLSEEKSAAKAIKSFNKVSFDFMWNLRFAKFKHDVDHHAKEEEQELFPKVRKLLDKKTLNTLGTKMRKFKAKLK
jgi:hemerythrin superfamily protein